MREKRSGTWHLAQFYEKSETRNQIALWHSLFFPMELQIGAEKGWEKMVFSRATNSTVLTPNLNCLGQVRRPRRGVISLGFMYLTDWPQFYWRHIFSHTQIQLTWYFLCLQSLPIFRVPFQLILLQWSSGKIDNCITLMVSYYVQSWFYLEELHKVVARFEEVPRAPALKWKVLKYHEIESHR